MNFEKYTEKSFVVRGNLLEESVTRKDFIKKLQGNGIWNTRLKGGPGLLVSINDHNKDLLEKMKDYNTLVGKEDNDEKKDVEKSRSESSKEDRSFEKSRSESSTFNTTNNDKVDKLLKNVNESPKRSKKITREEPTAGSESDEEDDSQYRKKKSPKYESDEEDDSRYRKKKSPKYESDEEDDSQYRKKKSPKYESDESEEEDDSHLKKNKWKSHSSSESENDSSEDERIQYTIRRKTDSKDKKQKRVLETDIDSEHEDIITCSRRLRGLVKRIEDLEKKLKKSRV